MAKTATMLDHALAYVQAGLPVVPLHSINASGHCTCGDKQCKSAGKHPRPKNGLKAATTDEDQVRKWWSESRWPNASIGGVGGRHLCLDIDAKSGGHESLQELIVDNSTLPDTAVALTGEYDGERGMHYWFDVPEDMNIASRANVRPGIDIRCYRGYAVLPPSPHASGVCYEWVTDDQTFDDRTNAPYWVLELSHEVVEGDAAWSPDPNFRMSKEVKQFLAGNHEVEPGGQRDFLCRAARSVLTTGRSVDTTASLLWEGYDGQGGLANCEQEEAHPWREDEVFDLVEDEFRKGPNTPLEKDFTDEEFELTDVGNARRLVESWPESHVFCVLEWDKWYTWNEKELQFLEDSGRLPMLRWVDITKEMIRKASEVADDDGARRLFSHALKSQSRPRVEAAVALAKNYAAVPHTALNTDPYLLNVANGVVDLRTGDLLDPDPKLLLTKRARANYDPDASSKRFDSFLKEVVPDKDLREFLQKAFGYSLTGSIDEHIFFYLHGPPAAGKSTLLEAFSWLMGNYAESADPSTFMSKTIQTSGGPSEDIARLSNARFVVTHEVEERQHFAEAHLSRLIGGDMVTARFLHAKSFEFRPSFKLWFGANHKPRVSGSARSGLWRRIKVIPMEQVIPEEDRDPTLQRTLRSAEVQSAMLQWAVEGCLLWLEDNEAGRNMDVPEVVRHEVEEYRAEADHVTQFFNEVLVVTGNEKVDRIPKPMLFDIYRGWCEREGRKSVLTARSLNTRLMDLGLSWRQVAYDGKRPECWLGVKTKGLPRIKERKR